MRGCFPNSATPWITFAIRPGLSGESGGDPFSVLPIMSAERVKRATQICTDLALDLQTVDIGIDTPGISSLYNAVEDLHRRLGALLKRDSR